MSAVETMPETITFGEVRYAGGYKCRVIKANGEIIGDIANNVSQGRVVWCAFFFGYDICGTGDTPTEAVRDAFGSKIIRLQEKIDRAKAFSVEHGDELMKLAEGLK